MNDSKVLICCDKIKVPNTGLYTFCHELSRAIERCSARYGVACSYLVPAQGDLPQGEQRAVGLWDRLCFRLRKQERVLHMTWQMESYLPRNKDKRKVILTLHDLNYVYEKSPQKVAAYHRTVQRRIDLSDHIVAISEYAKADLLKHLRVGDRPVDVIYNGCTFFKGEPTEHPTYKPQREFLFSIGTILRKKNFHVLPALLSGNDLVLVIAGNPSPYSQEVMLEADRLGVADRVKLVGGVSEADKDWYYRNCKAFVFPSIAEGFGLPVIEALHYGKPTFISRHTSLPEIGQHHCFYFDYDFSPERMREEFASGMARFERRNVQEQIDYAHSFSWDRAAEQYCEIYKRLLEE